MNTGWVSRGPLYLQVRDVLVERIVNGTWKPASIIPNEDDLARELGVSAAIVRKALDLMQAERVLTRPQGRDTFVNYHATDGFAERFSSLYGGRSILPRNQLVKIATGAATGLEQERLQLSHGEIVYRIHRIRTHMGRIVMVEDSSLPAALFPGLGGRQSKIDELATLAQEHRLQLSTVEERASIAVASTAVASALGIAPGAAVTLLDRIVRMRDGDRPVEWRIAYCRATDGYYGRKSG